MTDITTKELAIKLGCSQESVRTAKTKHKDKITDIHVYQVDGCNYWTELGQSLIAELLGVQGFNDTVKTDNDIVKTVEDAIAEILADDAIPSIEPQLNLDRIKTRAVQIAAKRLADKLKAQKLQQWNLVTQNLTFSHFGVAGELPSEVSHAAD